MEYLPHFLKMVKLDNMCNPYSYWSHAFGDYCGLAIVLLLLAGTHCALPNGES